MRIAFLGGGNMATALIGGLVSKGADARSISVIEVSPAARERLGARFPVHIATAPDAALHVGLRESGPGVTFQIFSQYSRIDRSEEKRPTRAAFRIAMRVHRAGSSQARLTWSWQSR